MDKLILFATFAVMLAAVLPAIAYDLRRTLRGSMQDNVTEER